MMVKPVKDFVKHLGCATARTTRKERMERGQVALQKVSNGMGISEVVDFVSAVWGVLT